ncbi:MAG: hypothetical protein R8K47_04935 [Mariprofundaceae bacterium]
MGDDFNVSIRRHRPAGGEHHPMQVTDANIHILRRARLNHRRTHLHCDPVRTPKAVHHAISQCDGYRIPPQALHQQRCRTAQAVAAVRSLAAVGVENAHRGIGLAGRGEQKHLITANAQAAIGKPVRKLGQRRNALGQWCLENDEIIALRLHLDEGQGRRAHVAFLCSTSTVV